MGRVVKFSLTTVVVVVIIAALLIGASLALFLQTVTALTREIPVAEVIMSPIQSDETGSYIEIQFTPFHNPTALESVFSPHQVSDDAPEREGTEMYKVYGDTVAVRGALIKLHPGLIILNYSNTYQLALVEGEYRNPTTPTTLSEGTEVPINGGFDHWWWDLNAQEGRFPYNLIIDRFTISGDEEPGFYGAGKKRYEVVMTMDAITWNFIEDIPA